MPTYFHGWRRKIGAVTLLMACLLMAGWVRSEYEFDDFEHFDDFGYYRLFATSGRLGLFRYAGKSKNDFTYAYSMDTDDVRVTFRIGGIHQQADARQELIGFHYETGRVGHEIRYALYTIPYWSIVLPLTLLSAYLLLSKSRVAKPPESN